VRRGKHIVVVVERSGRSCAVEEWTGVNMVVLLEEKEVVEKMGNLGWPPSFSLIFSPTFLLLSIVFLATKPVNSGEN
jgi:hypothetical protein